MRVPLMAITVSPLAAAVAVGTAFTCMALWSGSVPPATPRVAKSPPRPVHRAKHIRRVAFRPEPLVRAEEVLTGAGSSVTQNTIRVLLTKAVQDGRLKVTCEADMLVIDPGKHTAIARVPAGVTYSLSLSGDGRALSGPGGSDLPSKSIRILSLNASRPMTIGKRSYLGALDIRLGDAGLEVINEVRREDYIAGVLAGESVPSFPLGALKAQAVAARTYALSQSGHRADGVDVVDTVADQVYVGVRADWPEIKQAAEETAGLIATYNDEPIVAYFSADCGGATRNNTAAGLGRHALPYLQAVVDAPKGGPDYCSTSAKHTWTLTLTDTGILPKLNAKAAAKMAQITGIRFSRVYSDGRVGEVEIEGLPIRKPEPPAALTPLPEGDAPDAALAQPEAVATVEPQPLKIALPGFEFRKIVGTNVLKSQIMTIAPAEGGGWVFSGRGYGHGVGLCQWGACGMARAGIGFDAILKHYYTGIEITQQIVRKGSLEGIARDLYGAKAPGAVVRLAGTGRQTIADSKGRFRFDDLPIGTYDVVTTPTKGEAAVSFAWSVLETGGVNAPADETKRP